MMPLVSSASHPVQTGHRHTQKPLQVRRQLTGSESSGCTALFVLNVPHNNQNSRHIDSLESR